MEWISVLLTFNLSCKFRFTVILLDVMIRVYSKHFDRSCLWQTLCGSLFCSTYMMSS